MCPVMQQVMEMSKQEVTVMDMPVELQLTPRGGSPLRHIPKEAGAGGGKGGAGGRGSEGPSTPRTPRVPPADAPAGSGTRRVGGDVASEEDLTSADRGEVVDGEQRGKSHPQHSSWSPSVEILSAASTSKNLRSQQLALWLSTVQSAPGTPRSMNSHQNSSFAASRDRGDDTMSPSSPGRAAQAASPSSPGKEVSNGVAIPAVIPSPQEALRRRFEKEEQMKRKLEQEKLQHKQQEEMQARKAEMREKIRKRRELERSGNTPPIPAASSPTAAAPVVPPLSPPGAADKPSPPTREPAPLSSERAAMEETSRRELLERARLKRLNDELLKKEEEERKQRVRQKSLCFGGRLWWGLQEQEKLAQRAERARLQRLENSMPKAWEQLLWSGEFVPGREEIKQRIQNLPPREQEALLEQYDAHVTQQEKRKSASQVFSAYPDVSEQKVQHLSKPVSILADQSPSAAQMTRSGAQAPVSRAGGSLGTAPETKSYSAQLSDQHIQSLPPLIIAARHSHVNVIQVLLEEGADPNDALDEDGWTPLHYAAGAGNR